MSTSPELLAQARTFAAEVSELLNGTVTNGAKVSAVLTSDGSRCIVAKGVTKNRLTPQAIPLTLGKRPRVSLRVAHVLRLDDDGLYLTAAKSDYTVLLDEAGTEMVFHYDYDRSPSNGYPPAHFQVAGESASFRSLCEQTGQQKELKDLHFPVGGKRFRPSLEDIVEFLVVEGFVDTRDDWRAVLEDSRTRWYRTQLRAAVRRDEEAVRQFLRELEESRP